MKKIYAILATVVIILIFVTFSLFTYQKNSKLKTEADKKIKKELSVDIQKIYDERKNNLKRISIKTPYDRIKKYSADGEYIFGFSENGKLLLSIKKDSPTTNEGIVKYFF